IRRPPPIFTFFPYTTLFRSVSQMEDFLARGCKVQDGQLFNKTTGRRIAALMPVHLLGGMCDLNAVAELATRYELPLIEDAAECLDRKSTRLNSSHVSISYAV